MTSPRSRHRQETALALRTAAVRLMVDRGYAGTSTDDIARAAGVSPRTFFNYFPTKESVVALPDDFLAHIVGTSLRSRPAGEDLIVSVAATAIETVLAIAALPGAHDVLAPTIRLMFTERQLRQIFLERRNLAEEAAWAVLRERGVAEDDLAARVALASVTTLAYLGMRMWAEGNGDEPLFDVVTRCLTLIPDAERLGVAVALAAESGRSTP